MFGLDDSIAGLGTDGSVVIVMAIAVLLGLRHATDPDHLTAVSSLLAAEKGPSTRRAAGLGLAWGGGHGTSLILLGLPLVLFGATLPDRVHQAAEVVIGVVIMALAIRLVQRWRAGRFHVHPHRHGRELHRHLHAHADEHGHVRHEHEHQPAFSRSPLKAYGIGLVHGIGGSAGVGVLLLAAIDDNGVGILALVLFALCTAISMTAASTLFGHALGRGAVQRRFAVLAPGLGLMSFAFGAWYALGALEAVPYVF